MVFSFCLFVFDCSALFFVCMWMFCTLGPPYKPNTDIHHSLWNTLTMSPAVPQWSDLIRVLQKRKTYLHGEQKPECLSEAADQSESRMCAGNSLRFFHLQLRNHTEQERRELSLIETAGVFSFSFSRNCSEEQRWFVEDLFAPRTHSAPSTYFML